MVLSEQEFEFMMTDAAKGMAMSDGAVEFLEKQGYKTIETMVDLKDETIDALFKSATYSQWTTNSRGQQIKGPPVDFSHNSAERLKKFVRGLQFFEAVGRSPTAALVHYKMMKIIADQFKYLKEATAEDLPTHGKKECPIRFMARFRAYIMTVLSGRQVPVPLSYVIRESKEVPTVAPELAEDLPYSEEHGTVAEEMIERITHADPLFKNDNALVMTKFLAALQNSPLLSCIKSFERKRDGRGAVLAFEAMHCGHDKQEARIRNAEKILSTLKYTGLNPGHTLESLANFHRQAFSDMSEAVESGINHQLPNETTRARFFRDAIVSKDPDLITALSACKKTTSPYYNSFEDTVTHLVPECPVAKLRLANGGDTKKKRPHADISELDGGKAATSKTVYLPNTEVEARYYTPEEWKQLSDEQRDELTAYRKTSPVYSTMIQNKIKARNRAAGRNGNGNRNNPSHEGSSRKKMKRKIASLQKRLSQQTKEKQTAASKEDDEALFNSLVNDVATKVSSLKQQSQSKSKNPFSVSALLQQRKEAGQQ